MKGITLRQKQVLNFVQEFLEKNEHSPSYKDIQNHLGIKNISAVHKHIHALVRKNYIALEPHCSRSIIPTHTPLKKKNIQDKERSITLPFIGTLSYTDLIETFASPSSLAVPKFIIPSPDNAYVLQVKDNSYSEEQISAGDFLIIKTASEPQYNDIILTSIQLTGICIKRVKQYDTTVILSHLSDHSRAKKYPITDIHVHAIVVGLYRSF